MDEHSLGRRIGDAAPLHLTPKIFILRHDPIHKTKLLYRKYKNYCHLFIAKVMKSGPVVLSPEIIM